MSKFGETTWTESTGGNTATAGKDSFLRLSPGSNIVRLVTAPHAYYQHKFELTGGKKWGYRLNCSDPDHNKDCVVCQSGNKAKRRWFIGVIERKTGLYKILDIGYAVFQGIKKYASDDDWGDPSQYDIDIVVDPKAGPMNFYSVVCKPKKPLSADDIKKKEDADPTTDLSRRTSPPEPSKVKEKYESFLAESSGEASDASSSEAKAAVDDGESFFKDYDKKAQV
jgi:hypothetical protein